jgi:hypothetical protein
VLAQRAQDQAQLGGAQALLVRALGLVRAPGRACRGTDIEAVVGLAERSHARTLCSDPARLRHVTAVTHLLGCRSK